MQQENDGFYLGLFLGTLLGILIGCWFFLPIGKNSGRKSAHSEAVEHGVGEWVVVDEQGSTEFRWKGEEHADD